jgi:hypothetical protein
MGMSADGTWNVTMNTQMGVQKMTLILATSGTSLSGTMTGPQGSQEFSEGTVEGDKLAWKVSMTSPMPMTLEFSGTVDGDEMSGEAKIGNFGTSQFTGTRG